MNKPPPPAIPPSQGSLRTAASRRQKVVPRAKMLAPPTLLVLATPSAPLDELLAALDSQGYTVLFSTRAEEAFQHLARHALNLLLVELGAGEPERLAVIRAARNSLLPPPVILLGTRDTPLPPVAYHLQVADYLLFPETETAALRRVARALGRPHRRQCAEAEARLAAYNLKALLRIREMAAACRDLLQALDGALHSSKPLAPDAGTAVSEQEFTTNDSRTAFSGVIDLEVLA